MNYLSFWNQFNWTLLLRLSNLAFWNAKVRVCLRSGSTYSEFHISCFLKWTPDVPESFSTCKGKTSLFVQDKSYSRQLNVLKNNIYDLNSPEHSSKLTTGGRVWFHSAASERWHQLRSDRRQMWLCPYVTCIRTVKDTMNSTNPILVKSDPSHFHLWS